MSRKTTVTITWEAEIDEQQAATIAGAIAAWEGVTSVVVTTGATEVRTIDRPEPPDLKLV